MAVIEGVASWRWQAGVPKEEVKSLTETRDRRGTPPSLQPDPSTSDPLTATGGFSSLAPPGGLQYGDRIRHDF